MIALVDINNFYVSCERVFQPRLDNKPVLVLSNNDGCVISRSNEVKAMGIKMGVPFFEVKDLCLANHVHVFSSNYTLYASMSKRFQETLKPFGSRQEIYSIDENFLDVGGIADLSKHGLRIKQTIRQWLGLPVCVGIGKTKVLAKFANYLAKRYPGLNGVCNLEELGEERTRRAMQLTDVTEVWGVGRKLGSRLKLLGIPTILDLKNANHKQLRKLFNVHLEKIILELNGLSLLQIEDYQEPSKQIISSRSFATNINNRDALFSAFTYHITKVSEKLRKQQSYARQMVFFTQSNRFKPDYLSSSFNVVFPQAIDSFRFMVRYIDAALDQIYKPLCSYKKAGVIVTDIIDQKLQLRDLFDNLTIEHDKLLPSIENIKRKFGKSAITPASEGLSNAWLMRNDLVSPRYTTELTEIITVD